MAGRPKIEIDPDQFEKLLEIHATKEECAGWFRCSEDTIENFCKRKYKTNFSAVYKKHSSQGKISLRRAMFQKAAEGNTTMMIWLSKQHLGMSDKIADLAEKVEDKTINLKYRVGDKPHEPKPEESNAGPAQHTDTQ